MKTNHIKNERTLAFINHILCYDIGILKIPKHMIDNLYTYPNPDLEFSAFSATGPKIS